LKTIAERAVNCAPLLSELLKPARKQDLDPYLWGMEVVDFLIEHPSIKWTPQEFVDTLAKLVPRLYSISSSLKAHPDQVHFTEEQTNDYAEKLKADKRYKRDVY
jgi:sulfite reductase (NADPH) flavoprotein alpha-component